MSFAADSRNTTWVMAFAIAAGLHAGPALAQTGAQNANTGPSGLPLPRYVSLKSERVNMRVGPGRDYQVEWLYLRRGLPMEIIQEYDNWRKVRDPEGAEGWILHSLLSGSRTAIVAPWERGGEPVAMLAKPDADAAVTARLEPGVIADVSECERGFCLLTAGKERGFVEQKLLWGVYPDETIAD